MAKNKNTKTVNVTAYPYAVQYGSIEVDKNLSGEELTEYISEHWDEIQFGEPDLDYCGTDFDVDEEDD